MMPKKEGKITYLICRKCRNKKRKNIRFSKISEKAKNHPDVLILDKPAESLPTTEATCPKCENKKAFWWLQQTRAADEPPTQFFRCTKCGHTWREYK